MMEALLLLLTGVLAATCGSLVGLGGAFIIVPILALFFPMQASDIAGTSMAVLLFTAISSTWTYSKQKRIDYKSGVYFALAMMPGAVFGAWLTQFFDTDTFYTAFGIFLFCMALFLLFRPKNKQRSAGRPTTRRTFTDLSGHTYEYSYNRWIGLSIALGVGVISTSFGVGGGSVMVPTMVMLLAFPAHIATATSMFLMVLSAAVGTGAHAYFGHVQWESVLWLAIGALIGGQAGSALAAKLPGAIILRVLAASLIVVSLRLIFGTA
ncbi:sulfite exporter TauE/SafE family protein [Marinococcus halophilus]|uniref:Probable membrane transporter protein n=1 Tax=Marinococcus halophilus TaxID=1371 RepID=A0A510Y6B5_MARHA|nr:sulfite exporter TauE/SafE family protein [Marinococcus halophilus]GEK58908.1 UPF0721 transmembrane protein [Marinococcus halophilus]